MTKAVLATFSDARPIKTRVCDTCGIEKPLDDGFYKHKKMASGYLNKCKKCVNAKCRAYRAENDAVREYDRARYKNDPARQAEGAKRLKEYRKKYPHKQKANDAVAYAVRLGRIIPQPCEVCGAKKAEAHHDDYSRPLDVRWLCPLHHRRHHAAIGMPL